MFDLYVELQLAYAVRTDVLQHQNDAFHRPRYLGLQNPPIVAARQGIRESMQF